MSSKVTGRFSVAPAERENPARATAEMDAVLRLKLIEDPP